MMDVTSFFSSEILFSSNVCYKLYVSVDDRFIQSNNVCVTQDFKLFSGFYDRGAHENGLDEMVLFDRANQHLAIFNYKTEAVTHTSTDIILSFPVIELSTWGGITNVFAYDPSPPRLRKYRFPELTSSMLKEFSGVLFAVEPFQDFLFAAVEENGKSFQVLNRSNLNIIDSKAGMLGSRNIGVFSGNPNIVLEIGSEAINKYSVDASGKITLLKTKSPGISQPSNQHSSATGTEIFIGGRLGTLVDRDGNIIGTLNKNPNDFVFMSRLSPDEKKVAYVLIENNATKLILADISNLQNITHQVTFNLPDANFADVIIDDNIIYVIGVSFSNGEARTFMLKFPMS